MLRFDGVDDYLRIASPLLAGSTTRTVAFVARPTAVGNRGIIDLGDGTTSGGAFMITPEYGVRVSGGNRLFRRVRVVSLKSASSPRAERPQTQSRQRSTGRALFPASTVSLAVNTAGSATVGTFTADPINQHNFAGDIAEIIVYNRLLTPAEIDAVELYLSGKYGIAVTP